MATKQRRASVTSFTPWVVASVFCVWNVLGGGGTVDAAQSLKTKLFAVELGASFRFDVDTQCDVQVFSDEDIDSPWKNVDAGFGRENWSIDSIAYKHGGLYRINCSASTLGSDLSGLVYLIVFHIGDCRSDYPSRNRSGNHSTIHEGETLSVHCVFKYSVGPLLRELHWAPPLRWVTSTPTNIEDCRSEDRMIGSLDHVLTFNLCAKVKATAPVLEPLWLTIDFDFVKITFKQNEHIPWMSPSLKVSYAARNVTLQTAISKGSDGSTVSKVTCAADGFPAPSVRWLEEGTGTYTNGSQLEIVEAGGGAAGFLTMTELRNFRCEAWNEFDVVVSEQVHFTVLKSVHVYLYVGAVVLVAVLLLSVCVNVSVLCCRRKRRRRSADLSSISSPTHRSAAGKCADDGRCRADVDRPAVDESYESPIRFDCVTSRPPGTMTLDRNLYDGSTNVGQGVHSLPVYERLDVSA